MSSQKKDIVPTSMVISYQGNVCFPSPLSTPPEGKSQAGCISKTTVHYFLGPLACDCVIVRLRRRLRSPNRGDEHVRVSTILPADRLFTLACFLRCCVDYGMDNIIGRSVSFDHLPRE